MRRKLDKLDLKLMERDASRSVAFQIALLQTLLDQCRKTYPTCPYLESSKTCPGIQAILDTSIPRLLEAIVKEN